MWIDEEKWRQQQVTKFKLINDPLPHTCLYTDQPILKTKIELSCQAKIWIFHIFLQNFEFLSQKIVSFKTEMRRMLDILWIEKYKLD